MSKASKNINHGEIKAGGSVHIGDLKIQHILGNLQDYQNLEQEIEEAREVFNAIALDKQELRLKLSGTLEAKKEKLENIKKAIEQAFEYISKLTISTERLDQAKALFLKGDIPGALEILKDEAIQADYITLQAAKQTEEDRHNRRMEDFAEKTKGIAEEWKMKAVLMATRYEEESWFVKAKEYFQKALDTFQSNETILLYGTFLFKHNEIKGTIDLYENYFGKDYSKLQLSENIDESTMVLVENNIANLYLKVNDFVKAKIFALKSLNRIKLLAISFPDEYISMVPEAISFLALVSRASRDYNEAERLYLEALNASNSLSRTNKENKLRIQAKILNDLAVVQKEKVKFNDAKQNYLESVQKYKILSKKYPEKYLPTLSLVKVNLANLHSELRQNNEAQQLYLESIKIDRNLSKQNPRAYSLNLAKSLYNLANLYQNTGKYIDADQLYAEGLDIIRLFVAENPASFSHLLSHFLNAFASSSYKSKNFELAKNLYEEAIEVATSLAETNNIYMKELADFQNNLGLLFRDQKEINDAESLLLKAASNYEALLPENIELVSLAYARNLKNLCELYFSSIQDQNRSLMFAKKSLKIYIPFLNIVPEARENYEILLKIVTHLGEDVDLIIKSIQTSSNE